MAIKNLNFDETSESLTKASTERKNESLDHENFCGDKLLEKPHSEFHKLLHDKLDNMEIGNFIMNDISNSLNKEEKKKLMMKKCMKIF